MTILEIGISFPTTTSFVILGDSSSENIVATKRVANGGVHHCLECLPNQQSWQITLIYPLCYVISSLLEDQQLSCHVAVCHLNHFYNSCCLRWFQFLQNLHDTSQIQYLNIWDYICSVVPLPILIPVKTDWVQLHLSRFRSPPVTQRKPLQCFVISCIHQATCSALSKAYSAYASKLVSSTYRIPIRVNTLMCI